MQGSLPGPPEPAAAKRELQSHALCDETTPPRTGVWHRLAEDGDTTTVVVLLASVALGLVFGFAMPTDDTLPSAALSSWSAA